MCFYNILLKLCKAKGVKLTPLTKSLGISPGTIGGWKNGGSPTGETLLKFSEYFGVSTDFLLTGIEHEPPLLVIPDIIKDAEAAYHGGDSDFTQDEVNRLAEFAKFIKSQRGK